MLVDTHVVHGDSTVIWRLPDVREVSNAVYMPQTTVPDHDPSWGVYYEDGRLVEEAAYKRGPGRSLVGQSDLITVPADIEAIDQTLLYGGSVHRHFGHFLLSILPRYWNRVRETRSYVKIVMHCEGGFQQWLDIPFVREIFATLELTADDFVTFPRPARIKRLIVPEPSFQELSQIHEAFAALGDHVGRALVTGKPSIGHDIVYLSKERLTHGVWSVRNEHVFVEALRKKGVAVIYPECLPLAEQLRIFRDSKVIVGLMGSALHLSALCDEPKRIIAIGHNHVVPSNFALLDKVRGNTSAYLHPEGGMTDLGVHGGFLNVYECPDAESIAAQVAALI